MTETNIGNEERLTAWQAAWPQALAAWSRYTRLRDPLLCLTSAEATSEGLQGSFAMIRLDDQRVVIDLEAIHRHRLDGYAVEILAHEIGHHVLAPATVTDQIRLLARMRAALPTLERYAPMLANLYTDLFINDRLQRQAGLRMANVFRVLGQHEAGSKPAVDSTSDATGNPPADAGKVWRLYLGICEELWQCKGELGAGTDTALGADAWLGARLVRVYANEWLDGAGRFATLMLPYLVDDTQVPPGLMDTLTAGHGAQPAGVLRAEPEEAEGAIHPVHDARISGLDEPEEAASSERAEGQTREPFEYGETLRAAGVRMSDEEIAIRYYRERALPHLVPFPTRPIPAAPEPQMEGLEPWSLGDPLDEIDWLHSLMLAPLPIPGMTLQKRSYGAEPGHATAPLPVDLDMYVDSSGSMPDPRVSTSWPALAGAVIALSALRSGASVRVTLWSDKHQVMETRGFTREEDDILGVLTGFFGGYTAFPIHRLRDTWCGPQLEPIPRARPAHLLMISDEGIDTMFDTDERANSGWDIAASALRAAGAGGTMALALGPVMRGFYRTVGKKTYEATLGRAQEEQGWQISIVNDQADLLAFARAFSHRHYGVPKGRP